MSQIHPKSLSFLSSLKKNNNKPWFDKNKPLYEEIKNELAIAAGEVIKEVSKFDASVSGLDPKKTIFRIYRDIRFSSDKTPYKTNIGFWMSKGGMKILQRVITYICNLANVFLPVESGCRKQIH
jgi:uncharacterized protein (TIGR02453 family)